MVYALRGLSANTGAGQLDIEVDYCLGKLETYIKLVINILSMDHDLDILGTCHYIPDTSTEAESATLLPSWVSDWNTSGTHTPLRHQGSHVKDYRNFNASANHIHYVPKFSPNKTELRLDGFILDTILELSLPPFMGELRPARENDSISYTISDWFNWYYRHHAAFVGVEKILSFRSRSARYFTGESMFDVYWQTMIAGSVEPEGHDALARFFRDPEKSGNRCVEVSSWLSPKWLFLTFCVLRLCWTAETRILGVLWRRVVFSGQEAYNGVERAEADTLVAEKPVYIQSVDWTFAKTKDHGFVGLVPSSAQRGDSVGLFKRGKTPLILRRSESAGS